MSTMFGSLFKNFERPDAPKTLPAKKREETLEETEALLEQVAVTIIGMTQKIEKLKQCIKQQNAFLDNQRKQLRELQGRDWKTEIQGETKKSETTVISVEAQMKKEAGKQPPPPPPLRNNNIPAPTAMKTVDPKKVVEAVDEKPVVEETPVKVSQINDQERLQNQLVGVLAKRRENFQEEEWEDEDTIQEKKLKEAAENKIKAEEVERIKAVIKKYEVSVQQKDLVPKTPVQDENSKTIANEIKRLETKGAQPSVLAQLEDAVKELKVLEQAKATTVETPKMESPVKVVQQVETSVEMLKENIPQAMIQEIQLEAPIPVLEVITHVEIVSQKAIKPASNEKEEETSELSVSNGVTETSTDSPVDVKSNDEASELSGSQLQSGNTDVSPILENTEESIRAKFKMLCEASDPLKQLVSEKQPNIGVMKDILAIKHFIDTKHKEVETKNLDNDDKELYCTSLNTFYIRAAEIRLSNEPLGRQKMRLEGAAAKTFTARHEDRRILADVLMLISFLIGVGLVIGVGRVISGRSFFFSDAATQRESDFKKTLVEDESGNCLIATPAA